MGELARHNAHTYHIAGAGAVLDLAHDLCARGGVKGCALALGLAYHGRGRAVALAPLGPLSPAAAVVAVLLGGDACICVSYVWF